MRKSLAQSLEAISYEEKGTTEDKMVGQCHRSNQHEFDPTLGGGGRQEAWRALVHGVTKSRT